MQTLIWANILVGVLVLVFLFTANSQLPTVKQTLND